jgi:hypothetical protein
VIGDWDAAFAFCKDSEFHPAKKSGDGRSTIAIVDLKGMNITLASAIETCIEYDKGFAEFAA